ncbi:type II toxin-antitoxin system RelE/ParE family toxin [Brevundimonas sp. FT23042]|uniref:type II toxin-antitoxin system RelE/ParE family toxin n=1 Tax=Brevundimonas sp. FT23042 TaxID=3393749 RepID=UPI003B5891E7
MRRLVLTTDARADVFAVLRESRLNFGPAARARYRLLIEAAYRDLCEDPQRPGVRMSAELPTNVRLYPIRHSRARLPAGDRVGQPRHVVAFRCDEARVEVLHLLHESMDLPTRLR